MAADFSDLTFEIDHGTTDFLDFAVVLNGVPQNITGWTLWSTAKRRPSDADPGVFQKSTAGGGLTITNAAGGLGTVTLAPADTSPLPEERTSLFEDLKAKDGAGNIFVLAKWILVVRPVATETTT